MNLLAPRDVHVVLVAWNMDRIIHGQARILGVHVTPAIDLASTRDRKYHQPPTYLCVEPENTADRTRNLRQSNVNGYRLQRATDSELAEAKAFADSSRQAFLNGSHTPQASQATREMMRKWNYRLDTNFAKIERIHEPTIEAFTDEMQGEVLNGGLTVAEWTATLRNLTSDDPAKVAAAEVRTAPLF